MGYLVRRSGRYSARIRVPFDLVDVVGKAEIVKALGTSDYKAAKRLAITQVAAWQDHFEMLRNRRVIEPSDLARSPWEHYQAVLDRDELARSKRPTQNEIEGAQAVLYKKVGDADFPVDPLALLDAQLDYFILRDAAKLDHSARKVALAQARTPEGCCNIRKEGVCRELAAAKGAL